MTGNDGTVWLDVQALPPEGRDFSVALEAPALDALRAELELLSLERLSAEGHLWPAAEDGVIADFRLQATLAQACVVTLDPVGSVVDERVSLHYTPASALPEISGIIDIGEEDEDPPEPIVDGHIDIGAAMAEHLALALDPWPRAEGAELPVDAAGMDEARENPFAVLAQLKTKLDDKDPGD